MMDAPFTVKLPGQCYKIICHFRHRVADANEEIVKFRVVLVRVSYGPAHLALQHPFFPTRNQGLRDARLSMTRNDEDCREQSYWFFVGIDVDPDNGMPRDGPVAVFRQEYLPCELARIEVLSYTVFQPTKLMEFSPSLVTQDFDERSTHTLGDQFDLLLCGRV